MKSEMKKKTPNIASETISATVFAPANVPFLKSARSSIGARWRSSSAMKAARESTKSPKSARIRADVQPYVLASIRA